MSKQILEQFDKKFENINFHHKGVPCFNDFLVEAGIKAFIEKALKETREEAIKEVLNILKNYKCKQLFCDKEGDIVGGISIEQKINNIIGR